MNDLEDEERKNQLKWQVKLGESPVDSETREDILVSRAKAEYEYKVINFKLKYEKTLKNYFSCQSEFHF